MSHEIVAWHFRAEVPQPYGRATRDCYINEMSRDDAVEALLAEHPQSVFRPGNGRALTQQQLDEALGPGNGFLRHGDKVRCVYIP